MDYELLDRKMTILNHEGIDLTESIRKVLARNDYTVAQNNEYYAAFSGDRPVYPDRWLCTSELAGSDWKFCAAPYLSPKELLLFPDEKKLAEVVDSTEAWFYFNPAKTGLPSKNRLELLFSYDRPKAVYGLSYVFCSEEQELLIQVNNSHNPLPMRIWVNGSLVFFSTGGYMVRRMESVFRFNKGGNVILVERIIDPRKKIKDRYMDTYFSIGLRPVKQLLENRRIEEYLDPQYLHSLGFSNTVVLERTVIHSGEAVRFMVIPRKYCSGHGNESIQVSFTNAQDEILYSVNVKYFETVSVDLAPENTGIIGITTLVSGCLEISEECFFLIGDYRQMADDLKHKLDELPKAGPELRTSISRLLEIPDLRNGVVLGTLYPIDSNVSYCVFKAVRDIWRYLSGYKQDQRIEYHDLFPNEVIFFAKTGIYGMYKPYGVFLPKNYDKKSQYPLVIQYVAAYGIYPVPGLNGRYSGDMLYGREFGDTIVAVVPCFYDRYSDIELIGFADVIRSICTQFSVDPERISLVGFCGSASICTQVIKYLPYLFSAAALLSPYIDQSFITDSLRENTSNMEILQLSNSEKGLFPASLQYLHSFGNVDFWYTDTFEHEEFFNCFLSIKLLKKLTSRRRNRFPRKISFRSEIPSFGRAYWLRSSFAHDGQNEQDGRNGRKDILVQGEIVSGDEIKISSPFNRKVTVYYNRDEMGLEQQIRLIVNQSEKAVCLKGLTGRMMIDVFENSWEYQVRELSLNDFDCEYNSVDCHEHSMGIKQVYTGQYLVLTDEMPGYFQKDYTDNLKILLDRALKNPLQEKNVRRVVSFETLSAEILQCNNLIFIMYPGFVPPIFNNEAAKLPYKNNEIKLPLEVDEKGIRYGGHDFAGCCYALVKAPNPYNQEFTALYAAFDSEAALEGLNEFLKRFDTDLLFYQDAVIFHQGGYSVFQ